MYLGLVVQGEYMDTVSCISLFIVIFIYAMYLVSNHIGCMGNKWWKNIWRHVVRNSMPVY